VFDASDPFLNLAGGIPILNIFIGNGADGTAFNPNGANGGLLIGSGGDGPSSNREGRSRERRRRRSRDLCFRHDSKPLPGNLFHGGVACRSVQVNGANASASAR
jgi:hypothetical protein